MFERFADLSKEDKQKLTINDFTVSEIRFIIEETVFAKEVDALIAVYPQLFSRSNCRKNRL
jgi:hypothetical protein